MLEDFLDGWPGTLVVVSHDRYFLERVTDSTWALLGDGQVSMLPRGVEEYLERRAAALAAAVGRAARPTRPARAGACPDGVGRRAARGPQDRGPHRQAARPARRAGGGAARRDGRARRRLRAARRGRRTSCASWPTEKDALEEEWLAAATLLD